MSNIVVVGTMAFDSIETPFGKVAKIVGGSANYFALSASFFVPVRCISVIGDDYPKETLDQFSKRNIDLAGVLMAKGKTFHWSGRYGYDLNEAHTLATALNVFEKFEPQVPESYKDSEYVFLGNILPRLQEKVFKEIKKPKFTAIDTMNFWIESQRDALISAISRCNALFINEAELRQLTKTHNIVQAARVVNDWGPRYTIVKRGEYGAILFDEGRAFAAPAFPLPEVKDPTGAGDSFAGGAMGYLAAHSSQPITHDLLRKAIIHGCVMASFNVQDFGFTELLRLNRKQIDERYRQFVDLSTFDG